MGCSFGISLLGSSSAVWHCNTAWETNSDRWQEAGLRLFFLTVFCFRSRAPLQQCKEFALPHLCFVEASAKFWRNQAARGVGVGGWLWGPWVFQLQQCVTLKKIGNDHAFNEQDASSPEASKFLTKKRSQGTQAIFAPDNITCDDTCAVARALIRHRWTFPAKRRAQMRWILSAGVKESSVDGRSATVLCEVLCSRNSQSTMQWGNLCRLSYENMTARMVWQRDIVKLDVLWSICDNMQVQLFGKDFLDMEEVEGCGCQDYKGE